ncbi:bifunctional 3'-5' exonuclease/DNA polymerase [Planosporangium flavigriseum]|uniref:DNA-directed DNA polymerase n=1 Tax=Planosporangium flavigriseum TaxID=373681 RepID=A0A8J3LK28_9ACTN|nr:bifunctional 3'-5' exonuclease/DNA polymerase [Planosporangium flavigriseum]NJC65392.1 bifunctional 3'-5' exonuclease/DNA polymerase [Planosporangium flavigriseum]GIG73252.1 DNA polymerase I [Planosporangium flavigriseum]
MLVAVHPDVSGGGRLRELSDDGEPLGPVIEVADLTAAVRAREAASTPRWLWPATAAIYPRLLEAGVRVERCHDLELVEALLLGYEGRWGAPRALPAAWARLTGGPVPPDPPARAATPPGEAQEALFDTGPPPPDLGADPLEVLVRVYQAQRDRIAATADPRRMRLLVAAESAGGLVAAEMSRYGLPWRPDVHDRLLTEMLGEPSPVGGPPRRLAELTQAIDEAFGQRIHPDSPAEVLRAFARAGIQLPSTRAWVLQRVEHPAVPLLLEYKELYRIWVAHGWSWLEQWVRGGRFRAEYVPGGVVSGRWATRGGGALQIPKVVRRAVVADPGWTFVVADAGQLEPRILAAVSGDRRLAEAARGGDLYAALAADAFAGDRARAKVALLGAMYGQTGGQAAPALAALRRFYPRAWEYVEQAARTGRAGGLVRSWLGRTCPPGSVAIRDEAFEPVSAEDGDGPRTDAGARARGRFTRNFVIQATAAEWALALLARLRTALADTPAQLVFFQHDEVVVHCPKEMAEAMVATVEAAADDARRLLFGDTAVRFPLGVATVECYADAK